MKMKRRISSMLALLLVLVFALSACKEKTSTEADTKDATDLSSVTLRVGATGWNLQGEILKVAGLDDTPYKVEYTVFQGGNLGLEAMAADQIDFTTTSEIPPIFASLAENEGNFKIIAVNNSNTLLQELILPPNTGIKSVAELKGKKVGYIKSTTAQYFLYEMLKEAGLKWTDIDAVEISTADGVTALLGGNLDAFASYGNSINAAKNSGATTLASAQDILSGNFPYEASVKALGDNAKRAAIADYLARLQLAYEWQKGHLDKWAKISADPTGQTVEDALDVLKKGYEQRDTKTVVISDEIKKSEQNVADAFYEVGLLEKKVDVSTFYDDSLTKAYQSALEALKK
ncbi:ABC transporter substrate-binding protein [Anaerocolumna xylanovorans]|uniref:Sulfonate transport system substrate-binding protein n=1 Tax=Anaerocolumna xylanovorans DSM 12503 TaxID=1121345 RepID=A0A1M7XWX0_9FIRM|nr:ABC transporter substrate-binding protein [Anaerocolumna xylanovorans]SHO43301.1 sulfonate transport system substrate-binding protein [Anaerocolumna xylanovorans DSM 12503]